MASEIEKLSSPDVSEADPVEIGRRMKNMDDLDAHLFSTPNKAKSTVANSSPSAQPKPASRRLRDDLDDDLLDDIDDIMNDEKPKPVPRPKKESVPIQQEIRTEPPPPVMASEAPKPKPKSATVNFDVDDDPLDFDRSPRAVQKPKDTAPSSLFPDDDRKPTKGFLNDLLGKDSSKTRPSTTDSWQPKRSVHFQDDSGGAASTESLSKSLLFPSNEEQIISAADRPFTAPSTGGGNKFVSRFEMSDLDSGGGYSPSAASGTKGAQKSTDYLSLGKEVDLNDDFLSTPPNSRPTTSSSSGGFLNSYKPSSAEKSNTTPNRRTSLSSTNSPAGSGIMEGRRSSVTNVTATPSTKPVDANVTVTATPGAHVSSGLPPTGPSKKKVSSPGRTLEDVLNEDKEEMNRFKFDTTDGQKDLNSSFNSSSRGGGGGGLFSDEDLFGTLPPRRGPSATATRPSSSPTVEILSTSPVTPQIKPTGNFSSSQEQALLLKISKLEMEREHQANFMEMMKKRHTDEMQFMEESYKNKLQIIEDTHQRREQRMKEENDVLSRQSVDRLKLLEEERAEFRNELSRKLEQADRERVRDVERMREEHRREMDAIRREHMEAMDRLRYTRAQELETLEKSAPTTQSLRNVLENMQNSAKELSNWRSSVTHAQAASVEEKEAQLKAWEERLVTWEDRLRSQENENSRERARLQEIIAKMDNQLREQTRQQEEERWRLKQETNKMQALQASLDEERKMFAEQISKERMQLDTLKQNFLIEQNQQYTQLDEERRRLAEEKVQLHLKEKQFDDKTKDDKYKVIQMEAQVTAERELLKEDRRRVNELQRQLEEEKEKMQRDRQILDKEKSSLQLDKETFRTGHSDIQNRVLIAEARAKDAEAAEKSASEKLAQVKLMKDSHEDRLRQMQEKLAELHEKEKEINRDRLLLARERENLKMKESQFVCVNCRTPSRERHSSGSGKLHHVPSNHVLTSSTQGHSFVTSSISNNTPESMAVRRAHELALQMERDSVMQSLRMDYERDNLFLQEEREYLRSLQNFEY